MNNMFDAYHQYYTTGDMNNLIESLKSLGNSTEHLTLEKMWTQDEIDCIKVLALYINNIGFSYEGKNPFIRGDFHTSLKSVPAYVRLTIGETTVNDIKQSLISDINFNNVEVGSEFVRFDGKFYFGNIDKSKFDEYLTAAVHLYLFGLPFNNLDIILKLKNKYMTTGMIMQSVMYTEIGTELCNKICSAVYNFNTTVEDWCHTFDGVWFDVSNQVSDGFVSIFNPESASKVVCVSTLYLGKYFITNMNAFKELYEMDLLSTIRFANRNVKVQSVVNGKLGDIKERLVEVPIFVEDGEDYLVSDLVNEDYVYNELVLNDVGRL